LAILLGPQDIGTMVRPDLLIGWRASVWLFAAALTLHNAEEAVWLPAWSQEKGYWRIPATIGEARFVLLVLTILAYLCAWLAGAGSPTGTYLICGCALTMLLNVFLPHVAATIALRQYAPGTATAVLLNLPATCWLLRRALLERRITLQTFSWVGPAVILAILGLIPLLFFLSRWLLGGRNGRPLS
jgi:hypothetical protein